MNTIRQWNQSPEKGWKTFIVVGLAASIVGFSAGWHWLTIAGSTFFGMGLGFLIKTRRKHE
jgi:hypothetical protein